MAKEQELPWPFPKVWSRFSATRKDGSTTNFKIQDCPVEMYDDLMAFMVRYFMRDETWNKAIGIEHDEAGIEEFYTLQSSYLKERLVQICLIDDDKEYDMITNKPDILGFNVLTVSKKDANHYDFQMKSRTISVLFDMFMDMDGHNDVFERYNVNEVLGDAGVSVHPDYRGMRIGIELLKARIEMCKALGLAVVAATFTSRISQGAAEKCGFETYYEVPYVDFGNKFNVDFKTDSKAIKIMAYVIK